MDWLFSAPNMFIDVWNCQARLAKGTGNKIAYLSDSDYTPELHEEMLDIIDELGGGINMSGQYPIPFRFLADESTEIARAYSSGTWD